MKTAKKLFADGWRLHNWGATLIDTDEVIRLQNVKKGELYYWEDGWGNWGDRGDGSVYAILRIPRGAAGDSVLRKLSRLTEE